MLPEGIWVEESLWAGRTGQLYTQVVPVHMDANGFMGGGRPFVVPINPAMINFLGGLHINMKGCHVSRDGNLQGQRMTKEGASCACASPSATDTGSSGLTSWDSWEVAWIRLQWQACWCLLAGLRAIGRDEWDKAFQSRPYKPYALDPAMASYTLWRPAASKQ